MELKTLINRLVAINEAEDEQKKKEEKAENEDVERSDFSIVNLPVAARFSSVMLNPLKN